MRHETNLSLGSSSTSPVDPVGQSALIDYGDVNDVNTRSGRATGLYAFDPLFIVRSIGGYESNNYVASSSQNSTIYGAGFEWNPSPRTHFSGQTENRFLERGIALMRVGADRAALSVPHYLGTSARTPRLWAVNELLSLYQAQMTALAGPDP